MAHFPQVCGNNTQASTNSLNRFDLPNSDFSSVKIASPSPFMVQNNQNYAKNKSTLNNGLVGYPRPTIFKPTEASDARMVLKIRKQIDPASFLPDIANPSASNPSPLVEASNSLYAAVSASAEMAQRLAQSLFTQLNSIPSCWLGMPMAEAKHASALGEFETVDSFVNTFKNDFMIKVSPSLKGSSLKGATILVGETHHQKELEEGLLNLLKHLHPERGDMLLMEGGDDVCLSRITLYGIPAASCVNLEADSAAYIKTITAKNEMSSQLRAIVYFIATHLPQKLPVKILSEEGELVDFINMHGKRVLSKYKSALNVHLKKCKELTDRFREELEGTTAIREKIMLAEIRKRMTHCSTNFAVLGAQHVKNLASETRENFIFMMPRIVLETYPEMKLPLDKDEL